MPNAIVYGISGADELSRKLWQRKTAGQGYKEFYETQFFQFELSLQRDIIMQKDVIRSKRVLTMLSQMCDETAAKLRLISDMVQSLTSRSLPTEQKEFEEQCEKLSKALEEKKACFLHLSIIEMQQEAEAWMYEFFSKLRASILIAVEKMQTETTFTALRI